MIIILIRIPPELIIADIYVCAQELGDPEGLRGVDITQLGIRLLRIKDRFITPTSGGWADLLVNFVFVGDENKHVIELQLQHKQLTLVRHEGEAHQAYGVFRSSFEILEVPRLITSIYEVYILLRSNDSAHSAWSRRSARRPMIASSRTRRRATRRPRRTRTHSSRGCTARRCRWPTARLC